MKFKVILCNILIQPRLLRHCIKKESYINVGKNALRSIIGIFISIFGFRVVCIKINLSKHHFFTCTMCLHLGHWTTGQQDEKREYLKLAIPSPFFKYKGSFPLSKGARKERALQNKHTDNKVSNSQANWRTA